MRAYASENYALVEIYHYCFTQSSYRIVHTPTRKPQRIRLLFTHKNGDYGEISVTERRCAASILLVDRHISYRAFSHDVTAAILVFRNNETAAMLVYLENPLEFNSFLM